MRENASNDQNLTFPDERQYQINNHIITITVTILIHLFTFIRHIRYIRLIRYTRLIQHIHHTIPHIRHTPIIGSRIRMNKINDLNSIPIINNSTLLITPHRFQ